MWASLIRVAAALLLSYVAYAAMMFFAQRSFVFPVRRGPVQALPAGMQRVWLGTSAGRVEAWFAPPAPSAAQARSPALLFAHGNAEQLAPWPSVLEPARELGMGALLVEYPGYGRSEGSPSRASIAAAMRAGYDWLAAHPRVDPDRIVGFGRSLGGGAVCSLLGQRRLSALILQSTFTSLRPFVRGMLLPPLLLRDDFDNLAALRRSPPPVLVVHGAHDRVIPLSHGEALARAAGVPLLRYRCGHNDCPPDVDGFVRDVSAFLRGAGVL